MRKLEIKDQGIFFTLYRGMNVGGEVKGYDQAALATSIMTKLDSINVSEVEGGATLKSGGGTLEFTEREFEMLRRHNENASHPASLAKFMSQVGEMLSGAEKYEGDEVPPKVEKPGTRARKRAPRKR